MNLFSGQYFIDTTEMQDVWKRLMTHNSILPRYDTPHRFVPANGDAPVILARVSFIVVHDVVLAVRSRKTSRMVFG